MKSCISVIMVTNPKFIDLREIRSKLHRVKILDLVVTEIDQKSTLIFFVSSDIGEYNLTIGDLELTCNVKGLYNI